jgi:2-polyprenyl-3-methyl-5-hydroxy-6-metoxy-1,4-benzoquinol methylase
MDSLGACNLCGNFPRTLVWIKESYRLVRCDTCGLLYVENPPSQAELKTHYSFESGYHLGLAEDAATVATHAREARRNLRVLSQSAPPGRLLDVGCSTGLFLGVARESGWNIHGLEYSADSAQIARSRLGTDVVDQGELLPGRFAPASFDVVTMWDVIEHMPDPRSALRVVHEILKPGGLYIAKTPNADGIYPRASLAVASKVGYWGHPEPPGHLYQFSIETFGRMLLATGFETQRVYQQRIPLAYSFGNLRGWFRSLKWLIYSCGFAPLSLAGPYFNSGDAFSVVARKPA